MRIFKRLFKLIVWLVLLGFCGIGLLLGLIWIQHTYAVTLPKPTGPYPVGRIEYNWVDSTRNDPLAPRSGIKRELTVWVWYPATTGNPSLHTVSYVPKRWLTARDSVQGKLMSDFLTRDLTKVHPHAIRGAALSSREKQYPVVLFKPGLGAPALDYTTLTEDLASHGYIVVASDSPYSTTVVVYKNGKIVTRTLAGNPGDLAKPSERNRLIKKLIPVWVGDLRFELRKLKQIDRNDPSGLFTNRLNLKEVGAFGHSFGGAAAAQFCHNDSLCRAGIDIDGQPFGNVVRTGIKKPFMFILSDHSNEPDSVTSKIYRKIHSIEQTLPNWPNQITVTGARHFNFSDQALLKEHYISKLVGALGPINQRRALSITADYVRAFFDTYLMNKPDVLMQGPSKRYPEVKIRPK